MKIKKLKKAVLALGAMLITLALSSCMAMEQGLEFTEEGKVIIFAEISVEEEMLSQADTTKEDFFNSMDESEDAKEFEGWDKTEIEKNIGEKKHIGTRYYKEMTYEEINQLAAADPEKTSVVYNITETKKTIDVAVTYTYKGETTEDEGSEIGAYIAQGMMTTSFTIKTPYEILETNGTVSEDGTTVTWDTLDVMIGTTPEKVLTLSMEKPSIFSSVGVFIALGAAVLIPVLTIVILLATRKKPGQVYTGSTEYVSDKTQELPVITNEMQSGTADTEIARYCHNCGTPAKRNDLFCSKCGAILKR